MKHFVTCVIIFMNFMDELLKMFLLPDSAMSLVQWFFLFDKLSSMWLNVTVFWEICRKLRCDVSRCIIWLEDVNGQDATDTSVPFVEKLCTSFGRLNIITQSEAEELLVTWTVWHRGIRTGCLVHVFGWVERCQNMGILNKHVTNNSKTHARQVRKKNRPNSLSLTSPKTDMKGVTPISFREGFASATDSESWRLSQVGPY